VSVLVKVFQTHINPALEEGERFLPTDEGGESDGMLEDDDGKSTKSKSKAPSHITGSTRKGNDADKAKREWAALKEKQETVDNDLRSQKYQFCAETFRISKITDIKTF